MNTDSHIEVISQITTNEGLEMVMNINGKTMKRVFSHEQLSAFLSKERKADMKQHHNNHEDEPSNKRRRNN